ncbi:alpha/beta hydrolase [Candidatus Neomarinimicrobiota bacterium]
MKHPSNISRNNFLNNRLTALSVLLIISCSTSPPGVDNSDPWLQAHPIVPIFEATKGLTQLGPFGLWSGILYVPESYSSDKAMPLLVAMHGASGSSSNWKSYHSSAESKNMIFMAMDSRYYTWDLILGGYGSDLRALDMALQYVFNRCNIDPTHIALCGFSDGATYALSLGISNGDLFSHLIGFSPGFVIRSEPLLGKPKIYISHGNMDYDLPVEGSRDYIVPTFINMGYDVTYYEFRGGHSLPAAVSEQASNWFLDSLVDDPENIE